MDQRKFIIHLGMLVALCCVTAGLIYWQTSERPYVESLLKVNRDSWPREEELTAEEFATYADTQCVLLKSSFVVTALLRDNDINQLDIVKKLGRHPVDQLANRIEIDRGANSIISVRIPLKPWVSRAEARQWQTVLDGLVNAYLREVVNTERVQRVDDLAKTRRRYQTAFQMVEKKANEIKKLEEILGVNADQAWRLDYQLRNIDRLESKMLELELQLQALTLRNDTDRLEVEIVRQQITALTERRDAELEKLPQGDAASDGQLQARKQDYASLVASMAQLRGEMSRMESQIDGPARISQISSATISYEKDLDPYELASHIGE